MALEATLQPLAPAEGSSYADSTTRRMVAAKAKTANSNMRKRGQEVETPVRVTPRGVAEAEAEVAVVAVEALEVREPLDLQALHARPLDVLLRREAPHGAHGVAAVAQVPAPGAARAVLLRAISLRRTYLASCSYQVVAPLATSASTLTMYNLLLLPLPPRKRVAVRSGERRRRRRINNRIISEINRRRIKTKRKAKATRRREPPPE